MASGVAGRSATVQARRRAAAARVVPPSLWAVLAGGACLTVGLAAAPVAPRAPVWAVAVAPAAALAAYLAARRPPGVATAVAAGVWVLASPLVGVLVAPSPPWAPGSPGPLAGQVGWLSAMTAAVAFLLARERPGRAWLTVALGGVAFVGVGLLLRFTVPPAAALGALAAAGGVLGARTGALQLLAGAVERRRRRREAAARWEVGASGERATGALLERLDPAVFKVLHDRALPGMRANVDHLVIGPTGVFVVDSKLWAGAVTRAEGRWRYRAQDLAVVLGAAEQEVAAVARTLGVAPMLVVCVHGAALPAPVLKVPLGGGTVALVTGPQELIGLVAARGEVLDAGRVRDLARRARRLLPPA